MCDLGIKNICWTIYFSVNLPLEQKLILTMLMCNNKGTNSSNDKIRLLRRDLYSLWSDLTLVTAEEVKIRRVSFTLYCNKNNFLIHSEKSLILKGGYSFGFVRPCEGRAR